MPHQPVLIHRLKPSTLCLFALQTSDPALSARSIPSLMSCTSGKERQADSMVRSKDKAFINKMVKTLDKLEAKYKIPEHKRKKRLFTRKPKPCPIVPKEFSSIYNALAAPEPEDVTVPDPYPRVRWSDIRFKPTLPNPEQCPVYSCSQDPGFYLDKVEYHNGSIIPTCSDSDFKRKARHDGQSFGTLPGYKTNQGVMAIPTTPVAGYVFCPDAKKLVIFAEPPSSSSGGKEKRRGGGIPRRKG